MKPIWIAAPLVGVLAVLVLSIVAGPLWMTNLTMPVRLKITQAVRSISGFSGWLTDVEQLRQDRQKLASQRNKLLAEVADLQTDKDENIALKKQFKIDTSSTKDIVMAQTAGLVTKGSSSYLLINKGTLDQLKVGSIVYSDGVLVGRLSQVDSRTSLVQLPTTLGVTVPVGIRHQGILVKAVVEGSYNLTAKLTQVLPTDEISSGDTIETSADGGVYPSGIVVGTVGAVTKKDSQVFQTASVTLLWDIRQLQYVFVAK